MIQENFSPAVRPSNQVTMNADFVIVGGGLAGVCAAITAARQGTQTILVQDRPVLGGNASSEVRLWALGATSHMGNNNRWSREGGVMDEIMVENLYRNQAGNPVIFDTILLEKVVDEPNIILLLNTTVYEIEKHHERSIQSVKAFNSQNSTTYTLSAPLFCDASGDGVVAFKAGASFRIGAESKAAFGELAAPDEACSHLLGHSMFFYSKPANHPVKYVAPSYALKDISDIPRYKLIRKDHKGCNFWWFEYGGRKDTIHETEQIKWELWKVIYGVWDYIKNSGAFEGVENLDLEWVGNVPGKRESRRFEGLYMMTQQDVTNQQVFDDAVAYGGWAIDLHPVDGIYSELAACTQWHAKGIYDIPYRSYVSKDIDNLFLAGRIISASHIAFGSTRVMVTCGFGGQAVGMAASMCHQKELLPKQILENGQIVSLQNQLNQAGQSIKNVPISPESNLVNKAKVSATSTLRLSETPGNGQWFNLTISAAQLLPLQAGQRYTFKAYVKAKQATSLEVQLRICENTGHYTPDRTIATQQIGLKPGEQEITWTFDTAFDENQYVFLMFMANSQASLQESGQLATGIMPVFNGVNEKVSNNGKQTPPEGVGVEAFEFWIPKRRPQGKNFAFQISPPVEAFGTHHIGNGMVRPWKTTNAWVADLADPRPALKIEWDTPQRITMIRLFFDTDYDHAMETVQYGHPEDVMPYCIRNYRITMLDGTLVKAVEGNYQTINTIHLDKPMAVPGLLIEIEHPNAYTPGAIFEVLCQ